MESKEEIVKEFIEKKTVPYIAGIVEPQVLAAVEENPRSDVAAEFSQSPALEIRYDLFPDRSDWPNLAARIRRLNASALLIGTIRLDCDGGKLPLEFRTERPACWREILAAEILPDFLDLEYFSLSDFERLHAAAKVLGVKVLVSRHDFTKVPAYEELSREASAAKALGAEGFKIAAMSSALGDCEDLYRFSRDCSGGFSLFAAFAMGESGKLSRIWSLRCGANLSYGVFGNVTAPGQLPMRKMSEIWQNMPETVEKSQILPLL